METKRLVVLVSGASSGIGNAVASHLAKRGHRTYGTSRNADKYQKIADEFFTMLTMEASDADSIEAAVRSVLETEGRIDALVCCAAYGIAGPVEETPMTDAERQMNVNFLGTARLIHAALPSMRAHGGRIFVIGSMAGRVGIPFQAYYSASKFALEGFVEALRLELYATSVQLCLVDLGDFRTGFTDKRVFFGMNEGAYYEKTGRRAIARMEESERHGEDPIIAARCIHTLLFKRRLKTRYYLGSWQQRFALCIQKFTPDFIREYILGRMFMINS